jgi:Ala-tRNA(Pro) deacylase
MEACVDRLKQYLTDQHVYFEVQEHRQVYTMQEVAASLHEKGEHVAKVFIATVDGKPVMLVLPAPAQVDLDKVRAVLKAKEARRAREFEFAQLFADCDVGAMPPFGNIYQVPVYIDRSLVDEPYIVFQAGTHHTTMKIAMSDYQRLINPTVGDFTLHHTHESVIV